MHPQEYAQYTAEDNEVWSILFERQWAAVHQFAYTHFSEGLGILDLNPVKIPDFKKLNARLLDYTGWQVYPVPGLIANSLFFTLMADKQFASTTWIRKKAQLDYLEEPDLFHDTFGHIPLLADPVIAAYLHTLALIAGKFAGQEVPIERIARLYWYTIEFGLVQEREGVKIYGAGILSSIAETNFSLSPAANRVPFDLERILATPYIKDRFQEQYFVLDSIDQLNAAAEQLERYLHNKEE